MMSSQSLCFVVTSIIPKNQRFNLLTHLLYIYVQTVAVSFLNFWSEFGADMCFCNAAQCSINILLKTVLVGQHCTFVGAVSW